MQSFQGAPLAFVQPHTRQAPYHVQVLLAQVAHEKYEKEKALWKLQAAEAAYNSLKYNYQRLEREVAGLRARLAQSTASQDTVVAEGTFTEAEKLHHTAYLGSKNKKSVIDVSRRCIIGYPIS